MGVYMLLICLCYLCAASGSKLVNDSSTLKVVQNKRLYNYSYALRELFNEMDTTITNVITRDNTSQGRASDQGHVDRSKSLVQRMKKIFNRASRNTNNTSKASINEAIGVFRNVFNKFTSGMNKLYRSTREDNESKKYIEGSPVKHLDSIQSLLERLKKFDYRAGKHKAIYYEEGSGNEIDNKSTSGILPHAIRKVMNSVEHIHKVTLPHDDTEGSGVGSGDDESGSGSNNEIVEDNVFPINLNVTQGTGYQEVINFVARDSVKPVKT